MKKLLSQMTVLAAACCILFSAPSCQDPGGPEKMKQMEWLLGDWKGEADGQPFHERWTRVSDARFDNINYSLCSGDTVIHARSRIELRNGALAYTSGDLVWPLKSVASDAVVFENAEFGERFTFQHTSDDGWHAVLEYPDSKLEYTLARQAASSSTRGRSYVLGHFEGAMEYQGSLLAISFDFDTLGAQQRGRSSARANLQLDRVLRTLCYDPPVLTFSLAEGGGELIANVRVEGDSITGRLQGEIPAFVRARRANALREVKPYTVLETTIDREGTILPASIFLPIAGQEHPGVVMVCGTGQHTRDEYYGWADLLARSGIAVLTYDKRNVTDFPKLNIRERVTDIGRMEDLVSDAKAAVARLRSVEVGKVGRVGIIGFSQGAVVAPMVAASDTTIAFVVAISGNATTDKEFIINQELNRLREVDADPSTLAEAERIWNALFGYVKSGSGMEELQKDLDKAYAAGWGQRCLPRHVPNEDETKHVMTWNSFELDPADHWRRVRVPSFVAFGGTDRLIPVERSATILKQVFKGKEYLLTLKVYPGADHTIKITPSSTGFVFPRFAEGYPDDVVRWITGLNE